MRDLSNHSPVHFNNENTVYQKGLECLYLHIKFLVVHKLVSDTSQRSANYSLKLNYHFYLISFYSSWLAYTTQYGNYLHVYLLGYIYSRIHHTLRHLFLLCLRVVLVHLKLHGLEIPQEASNFLQ